MNHFLRVSLFAFLSATLCFNIATAQETAGGSLSNHRAAAGSPGAALASQVREIANSSSLSVSKKEKRISNIVRLAVVAATAYRSDSGQNLEIAIELASAAARAAPRFADVISNAVSFTPVVSRIDGAAAQIRTAAYAAARNRSNARVPREAAQKARARREAEAEVSSETANEPVESPPPAPVHRPRKKKLSSNADVALNERAAAETAVQEKSTIDSAPDSSAMENSMEDVQEAGTSSDSDRGKRHVEVVQDTNSSIHTSVDLSVRHDDNVFLTTGSGKTSDDIISVRPGVQAGFGENTLTHANAAYQLDVSHYIHKSAPNARLSHASGDFGYDNGTFTVASTVDYNQTYQNNRDVAGISARELIRSNSLTIGNSLEGSFTPKTSVGIGIDYDKLEYVTPGLTGYSGLTIPINAYYKITPKTDVFAGVNFRTEKVQTLNSKAQDRYYNVGARGTFTPKLTGTVSVGERKRKTEGQPSQGLPGFNGSLTYEVTPKTNAVLGFDRDFSVSAFGQSLHSSNYSLKLDTALTTQWDISESINYRTIGYGYFFDNKPIPLLVDRKDSYWEGNIAVTYIFSHWLSFSGQYTLRNNHSTYTAAEFSNNLISLMASLRY